MLGLNDAHIGHTSTADLGKGRAGHEKGDGKYVLSRSPDYILMGNVRNWCANQSTSCGLSRDFMTPMNSFVSS